MKSKGLYVSIILPVLFLTGLTLLTSCGHIAFTQRKGQEERLSSYVRPLIGTHGEGNVYPGPSAPFGMVQISPDTDKVLWATASGYEYSDPTILGFSLTHLSGTGIPDLGDFLFIPQVGQPAYDSGEKDKPDEGYQSTYSHEEEVASAGYYKVKLHKSGVTTELTAGKRAGMLRFTFPAADDASIMTDLAHVLSGGRWKVAQSHVRIEDNATVTGYHLINGWAKERHLFYAARYSRPFDEGLIISSGKPVIYDSHANYRFRSRREAAGKDLRFLAKYKTHANEAILVKVAVSTVSAANALENLDAELSHWDFEKVVNDTCTLWDKELACMKIEGTQKEKETFYTALYHAFLTPNLHEDVNGQYRGLDQNTHESGDFTKYTVFSLWDTYRATHPLFALIQAKRNADMVNSMLAHYDQSVDRLLPVWELQANETWCMIGYHAVPVIADAYLKGNKGFDPERAYEAVKTTAMNPDYDAVAAFDRLGWVPFDQENEAVSKTLEYAYDDYTIAQMANALGKTEDYHYFMKRADNYKNIYDPETGFMRGRDSDGNWRTPFDPQGFVQGGDFTEGTSWQYSWYVPHDVPGLIELMGGNEAFCSKLDQLFVLNSPENGDSEVDDIYGRIGEYWHGNEPSHHIVYLYCYAGQPWKAQKLLHTIIKTQYGNQPNSLTGNDDCGQMSAWYIFTCMGFYPVAPAADFYVIGAPQLQQMTMHLSNEKSVTMTANKLSEENIYIQSLRLNGKNWVSPFLPFSELKNGGTLIFEMGPRPNKQWGVTSRN
jgi:predicted alpha-1,2-mannosidase